MNAIFKKDKVFVYVTDTVYSPSEDPSFVTYINNGSIREYNLFGGRVNIHDFGSGVSKRLRVDGIEIWNGKIFDKGIFDLDDSLPIETIVAYLNQMAALGIDAFLENYKKALQEFEEEMLKLEEKYEGLLAMREDEVDRKRLDRIKETLVYLKVGLFNLSIHRPFGLDDQLYEDAQKDFVNRYVRKH